MDIRLLDLNKDYETLSSWWTQRNHVIITKDFLSDYGVLASKNGKDLAAMWLYPVVSTKWCMVRFPIANPDTTKAERDAAMDLIINTLHLISKDMGYKYMFCTTNHPGLIKRLKSFGFVGDSENCINFWGGL